MESSNPSESLLHVMPYNSWKKRCFLIRYSLDKNYKFMLTLQIVFGIILTLHPCMTFALLTVFTT